MRESTVWSPRTICWKRAAPLERCYVFIVKVRSNQEYSRQMVANALADFAALRKKYSMLVELTELFQLIDDFRNAYPG